MTSNESIPREGSSRRRRTLLLGLALLAVTAGAGVALRAVGHGGASIPAGGLPLAFRAKGSGPVHFSAHLDRGAVLEGGDGEVRLELVLQADVDSVRDVARLPGDLVVVLDRSGSMSGEKIAHARAAVAALVDRLGPQDRFALVTYSDSAELRIPLATATPEAKRGWLETVARVPSDGGTNLSAGLDLGLGAVEASRMAGRAPRVILISDGLANQGDVSREGLRGRASRATSGEYALSTIGVGADFDEEVLAGLADAGSGNFHYLQNAVNLSEIFSAELDTARETVASGVAIRLAPADGVVWTEAAGYPVERGADGSFTVRPGTLFAGQERRFFATLRVPASGPPVQELGEIRTSYRGDDGIVSLVLDGRPKVARVARQEEFVAKVDRSLWSEGVVVEAYNRLRREVAQDVKRGDADAARGKIESYARDVARMNRLVASPEVEAQLEQAKDLSASVAAAAAAPAPMRAQEAKKLQADALDAARPGAKKP